MARVIERLPQRTGGGSTKYPWDEWTDGRAWAAVRGEDYGCTHAGFRVTLHNHARASGLHVQTRKLTEGGEQVGLAFQFSRNGADR